MQVTIYHNPRCSKSRKALDELKQRKADIKIINYMDGSLSAKELTTLCSKLGLNPWHIARRKESRFKELHSELDGAPKEKWAAKMVENPQLIERPIIVVGKKAIIGKDPLQLSRFLDSK